jgi:hypothetical protein
MCARLCHILDPAGPSDETHTDSEQVCMSFCDLSLVLWVCKDILETRSRSQVLRRGIIVA